MLNSKPKELECVAVAVRPCLTRDQIGSNFYIKPAGCISRWVREGPIEFNEQCPLFDLRPDSMANLWRAPGNLRKSMEIPGEMDGNVRINENSSRITNRIPTDIDIMTRG